MRRLFIFFFATLSLLAGFALLGVGTQKLYRNWQFSGEVERISGRVDQIYETESGGRHSTTSYMIAYHYGNRGDVVYTTLAEVGRFVSSHLHVGQDVPIKYLPYAETLSRIDLPVEDQYQAKKAWNAILCGIVWIGIGLLLLWLSQRPPPPTVPISEVVSDIQSGWRNR